MKTRAFALMAAIFAFGGFAFAKDKEEEIEDTLYHQTRYVAWIDVLKSKETLKKTYRETYTGFIFSLGIIGESGAEGDTQKDRTWFVATSSDNVSEGEKFTSIQVFIPKTFMRGRGAARSGRKLQKSQGYKAEFFAVDQASKLLIFRVTDNGFKLQKRELPALVGEESFKAAPLSVGDTVYTVSSPDAFNLWAITKGEIKLPAENERSGIFYNDITMKAGLIYHSCDLGRGSFGSPLLRIRGETVEVIGINLKWKKSGGATSNEIYALPIDEFVKRVIALIQIVREEAKSKKNHK